MTPRAAACVALAFAATSTAACVEAGDPTQNFFSERSASEPATVALGARLLEANQPQMALDAFSRVLAADGVSAEALVGLGVAYHALGRLQASVEMFEAAADLDPNSAEARNNLGVAYYANGEYAAARSEFERAFALTGGTDPKIRFNLGVAEIAFTERANDAVVDEAEFDVIQYGHGVYRLEKRERGETASPEQVNSETEAQS
ncbi:MAG: tetratricopeptide repeat protein [Pseudomonadota bacterium]